MLEVPNTWRKIAVVDLGYNSLKMVSYEVRYDGSFRAYNQVGELTRIGEGVDRTGYLKEDNSRHTIQVLKSFGEVTRVEKIHQVLAVATSAVRDAGNGKEFVEKAKKDTGIDLRILSAEEEALFSYLGCAKATNYPNALFFDLGGGSLELVYTENSRIRKTVSIPSGALRMTELFGVRDNSYSKKSYEKLRARVLDLIPDRNTLGLLEDTVLVGVGGTLRAVARLNQKNRNYPLQKMHNYSVSRQSVEETHRNLLGMSLDSISGIGTFGKGRAGSITTGSLIIGLLMKKLNFQEVVVSSHGLRDGIITEYFHHPKSYRKDIYTMELANRTLAEGEPENPRRDKIYSLRNLGLITEKEEKILQETLGNFMDAYLSTRPEALFYLVISQDSTLTHEDQLAAAVSLVRAKAPRAARWFQNMYSSLLTGTGKKSINRMSTVIQLTELLYITGSDIQCSKSNGTISITVSAGNRKIFPVLMLEKIVDQLKEMTELKISVSVV